jgi:hypothetical protein
MGVDIARAWSTRPHADLGTNKLDVPGAEYSGTAAIFTPAGNVRIVTNDQRAVDTSGNYLEQQNREAYRDLSGVDYIELPSNIRVAGIRYTANGPEYIPPPFALTFNAYGNFVNRTYGPNGNEEWIFYNADYSGGIDIDATPIYASPVDWDGLDDGDQATRVNGKLTLPSAPGNSGDAIPTVTGIRVYEETPRITWPGNQPIPHELQGGQEDADWPAVSSIEELNPNYDQDYNGVPPKIGTAMYFSPHSGVQIRSR